MSIHDKLLPYAAQIKEDAAAGNNLAKQIMQTYQMHVRAPHDPGAPALCECFFRDWLATKQAP